MRPLHLGWDLTFRTSNRSSFEALGTSKMHTNKEVMPAEIAAWQPPEEGMVVVKRAGIILFRGSQVGAEQSIHHIELKVKRH